ncbi:MAG: UDP-N-acetylmuramate dehydrogenase [Candidatus Nomurabacteria bacterium]|jgi:UDP-N-acetylmuramate dehydrogenase|nr:UDP-N-acetylmuramate dehydrogenase [Candidatus Nomurabacteria bacterium]
MQENVLISKLTTMRLGGPARYVQEVTEPKQVAEAYDFARKNSLPVYVLGYGSNVIGRDEGFDGLVLVNKLKGVETVSETGDEVVIKAASGEMLDDLCGFTAERGYTGIEAMSAIPGTVGAAPVQNVGAYGQEIANVLVGVSAYDTSQGRTLWIDAADCQLGYRRSIFNTTEFGRYFITAVTIKLRKGQLRPPFYISLQAFVEQNGLTDFSPMAIRQAVTAVRAGKLPDPKQIASSGSFFKNVVVDDATAAKMQREGVRTYEEGGRNTVPSGWLIEQTGLKGKEFHGMRVSDKAALILINESAHSYADLAAARQEISDAVYKKFGFRLEQEPVELA